MLKLVLLFMILGITYGIPIHFPSISKPIINSQKRIEIPNDECGICNYIVVHSEEYIFNSTIEKDAMAKFKKVCETLPRKRQGECLNMIQQNFKRLIRMISKKEDSSIICSDMHICSIPQNNVTDCTFCKYAISLCFSICCSLIFSAIKPKLTAKNNIKNSVIYSFHFLG